MLPRVLRREKRREPRDFRLALSAEPRPRDAPRWAPARRVDGLAHQPGIAAGRTHLTALLTARVLSHSGAFPFDPPEHPFSVRRDEGRRGHVGPAWREAATDPQGRPLDGGVEPGPDEADQDERQPDVERSGDAGEGLHDEAPVGVGGDHVRHVDAVRRERDGPDRAARRERKRLPVGRGDDEGDEGHGHPGVGVPVEDVEREPRNRGHEREAREHDRAADAAE